jgi:hypothetical protein
MRVDLQRIGGAAELGVWAPLQSGIWQYVSGLYVSNTILSARTTWTGAQTPDSIGTAVSTCDDWTSTAGTGYTGDPTLASPAWFGNLPGQTCSMARRVYCLRE